MGLFNFGDLSRSRQDELIDIERRQIKQNKEYLRSGKLDAKSRRAAEQNIKKHGDTLHKWTGRRG
jgi:hypothetical protein